MLELCAIYLEHWIWTSRSGTISVDLNGYQPSAGVSNCHHMEGQDMCMITHILSTRLCTRDCHLSQVLHSLVGRDNQSETLHHSCRARNKKWLIPFLNYRFLSNVLNYSCLNVPWVQQTFSLSTPFVTATKHQARSMYIHTEFQSMTFVSLDWYIFSTYIGR